MAYGITSESQLIDYKTIKAGCEAYITALDDYVECSNKMGEAASILNSKALSVDDATLQDSLYQMQADIMTLRNEYATAAEQVYTDAVNVYNQQVSELNDYYRRLAEEEARKRNNG